MEDDKHDNKVDRDSFPQSSHWIKHSGTPSTLSSSPFIGRTPTRVIYYLTKIILFLYQCPRGPLKYSEYEKISTERSIWAVGEETGKLRETCSYFLVAYFFPGSEVDSSVVPAKMVQLLKAQFCSKLMAPGMLQVRDGFTTCFVTDSTLHLESSIIDCFSEEGFSIILSVEEGSNLKTEDHIGQILNQVLRVNLTFLTQASGCWT